jgi:hypothetical protein
MNNDPNLPYNQTYQSTLTNTHTQPHQQFDPNYKTQPEFPKNPHQNPHQNLPQKSAHKTQLCGDYSDNPLKKIMEPRKFMPKIACIGKDEIKIKCAKNPHEYAERICTLENMDRTRLISWDDILDDPEYWKKFKERIVNINDYVSCLFEDMDLSIENKRQLAENMPEYLKR